MKRTIVIMGDDDFAYSTFLELHELTGYPLLKTYSTIVESPFEIKIEPIELNKMKDNLFYYEWVDQETNKKPPHIKGTPKELLNGGCVIKLDYEQLIELISFKQKSLIAFVSGDIDKDHLSNLTKLGKMFPIYILDKDNTLDNTIKYVLKES